MSPIFFSFAARLPASASPPASMNCSTADCRLNLYFFSHFAASVALNHQLDILDSVAHEAPVISRNSAVMAFSFDLVIKRGCTVS